MREDTSNIVDINGWKVRRKDALESIKKHITEKQYKLDESKNESILKLLNGLNINLQQSILFEILLKPKNDESSIYDVIVDPNFDENLKRILWDIGSFVTQLNNHFEDMRTTYHQIKDIEDKIVEVKLLIKEKQASEEKARQTADAEVRMLHDLEAERIMLINKLLEEREQLLKDYMQAKEKYEELKFAYNKMLDISAKEMSNDLRKLGCFDQFSNEQLEAFSKRLLHNDIAFCHHYKQDMQQLEQKIAANESKLSGGNGRMLTASFNQQGADRRNIEHKGKMVSLNDLKAELVHKKRNFENARKKNINDFAKAHGVKPTSEQLDKIVETVNDKKSRYNLSETHNALVQVDNLVQKHENRIHQINSELSQINYARNTFGEASTKSKFTSQKSTIPNILSDANETPMGAAVRDSTLTGGDLLGSNFDIAVSVDTNFSGLDMDLSEADDNFGLLDSDLFTQTDDDFSDLDDGLLIESDKSYEILPQAKNKYPENVGNENSDHMEQDVTGIKRNFKNR